MKWFFLLYILSLALPAALLMRAGAAGKGAPHDNGPAERGARPGRAGAYGARAVRERAARAGDGAGMRRSTRADRVRMLLFLERDPITLAEISALLDEEMNGVSAAVSTLYQSGQLLRKSIPRNAWSNRTMYVYMLPELRMLDAANQLARAARAVVANPDSTNRTTLAAALDDYDREDGW